MSAKVIKNCLTKNREIGTTTKEKQKQVYDLQCNALTSLVHLAVQLRKVDKGCKCTALEVIHLFLSFLWQS